MIPVQLQPDGTYERIDGNPVILSLDGEVVAPLRTILADSWSDEDRAEFGIYMAEPAMVPAGKMVVGQPRYEKRGGRVVEIFDVEDAPPREPGRYDLLKAEVDALAARIDALEKR